MNRLSMLIIAASCVTACASSSGVVPIGKDTYSITSHDNGPAASLTTLKADAYRTAGAFCAAQGKTMKIVGGTDTPRSFGQFPQTEVQFACQ